MSDLTTTFVDLPAQTTPIDADYLNAVNKRLRSRLPVIDAVEDYGVTVGGGDDTTAWQATLAAAVNAAMASPHRAARIICGRAGESTIGGALQDTSGANAQLTLPAIDYVDAENITIYLEGPVPPPNVYSVIGPTPLPKSALVFKSTLTSGGGALLGAVGPAGTFGGFTNITFVVRNVVFRMPANPTGTALDLRHVAVVDLDWVSVDASNFYADSIALQSSASSFGIRLPSNGNGAHVRLGTVNVGGFYNGIEHSEHAIFENVSIWACREAVVPVAADHPSQYRRLGVYHCQRGIVPTGAHYLDVGQYAIEHAASGTWVTAADVDDPSNYLHGSAAWSVVLANVGQDTTFTKNGGAGFNTARIGTAPSSTGLTVRDENGTIATGVTQIDFQGAGVTASAGTGEVVVTIPGGSSSSTTTAELLMQDGVTGPPVPLETEARDDWLYQG